MGKSVQSYTPEFRAEAVKLVLAQGLSLREASQRMGISKGTVSGWVSKTYGGKIPSLPGIPTVAELERKNRRLR